MANRPESKKEKSFRKAVTEYIQDFGLGVLYKGYEGRTDLQRHHVLGKSAKKNKIHIGYWFLNAIPFELHDVHSDHNLNVTHNKNAFKDEYGNESSIYERMIEGMRDAGYGDYLPPDDVFNAIMATGA